MLFHRLETAAAADSGDLIYSRAKLAALGIPPTLDANAKAADSRDSLSRGTAVLANSTAERNVPVIGDAAGTSGKFGGDRTSGGTSGTIGERTTASDGENFNNHKTHPGARGSSSDVAWRLRTVLAGAHAGWVRAVTVDHSNAWFATGLADASIKLWDLASGRLRASIGGHILAVRSLAVSRRYAYMFSGGEDKTVRCWDLERTGAAAGCQVRTYHGHVGGVFALALHPELDLLFSAGRDAAVRVWDMRTRAPVMVLSGHRGDVTALTSQLADPQVCSAGMDGTVRLWDLRRQKTHLALAQHRKGVRLLVQHPHELTLASSDGPGVRQWLLPGGELLAKFGGDGAVVNTLAVNPATNELFAGHADGEMRFYDYVSGEQVGGGRTPPAAGSDHSVIYALAFDMLGLRLITAESDKSVKIWEPAGRASLA